MRKVLIGQWCVETHATDDNIYILIPFNCEVLIDSKLLGKTITLYRGLDKYIKIVFPKIKDLDTKELCSGIPFEQPTFDISSWGTIRGIISGRDTTTKIISISAVWCICDIKFLDITKTIGKDAEWILRSLQALSPQCIFFNDFDTSRLVNEPIYAYFDHKEVRRRGCLANNCIQLPPLKPHFIELRQIKEVLKNFGKSINLPYELLLSAHQEMHINNYRNAILNCASAIEVALKKYIYSYIDSETDNDSLKQYILKKIDGFSKIEDFLSKNNLKRHNNEIKDFMILRNRVIHGGYMPTKSDATDFINLIKEILVIYQVPHFT